MEPFGPLLLDDSVYKLLNLEQRKLADQFYASIKDRPDKTIQRYERVLRPKHILDYLCDYVHNQERLVRHAAVRKNLLEKKLL